MGQPARTFKYGSGGSNRLRYHHRGRRHPEEDRSSRPGSGRVLAGYGEELSLRRVQIRIHAVTPGERSSGFESDEAVGRNRSERRRILNAVLQHPAAARNLEHLHLVRMLSKELLDHLGRELK